MAFTESQLTSLAIALSYWRKTEYEAMQGGEHSKLFSEGTTM